MKFLSNHWKALADSRSDKLAQVLKYYGVPSGVALVMWILWDRSLGAEALGIIATVQSVVATVLLTVMGSIYSGLPSAIRRARMSRAPVTRSGSLERTDAVDIHNETRVPLLRQEYEETRVAVLRGLFSHNATAVAYALLGLPLIVAAVQLGEYDTCQARSVVSWLSLAVLIDACTTIAIVFLVLIELHELVLLDSQDPIAPPE